MFMKEMNYLLVKVKHKTNYRTATFRDSNLHPERASFLLLWSLADFDQLLTRLSPQRHLLYMSERSYCDVSYSTKLNIM